MKVRLVGIAALAFATGLALAGCSGQPMVAAPSAGDSSPAPTDSPAQPAASAAPTTEPPATEPDAPVEGAYLDYSDGAIAATRGLKALFFHASWCPNCRQLDEELTAEGAPDGLTVFKVDYDSRTDLRQKYGVTIQTTIVFVDDDGDAISSAVLYDDPSVASLVAAIP